MDHELGEEDVCSPKVPCRCPVSSRRSGPPAPLADMTRSEMNEILPCECVF